MDWEVWGPPLVVLLVGLVAGLVLTVRSRGGPLAPDAGEREALQARKEMLMEQLRAMEADRDKLEPAEFAARREALVAEAALVLRALEESPEPPPAAEGQGAPASPGAAPSRAGTRVAYALGTIAFFALLGVGLTEFSRPRAQGETMTGGISDGSEAPPAAAPAARSAAVQAAQATLTTHPDDLEALNVVSYDHLLRGELDQAMAVIDRARAIAPKDAGVLTHLAMLQLAVGMSDRAVAGLEEAAAARPEWGRPRLWMGLALLQTGQPDAARASLEQAMELGLDDPQEQSFALQLLREAANPAPAAASGAPPAAPTASAAPAGPPRVSGTLSLAEGVAPAEGQQVFLIVHRNAAGSGPPVAAKKLPASALPVDFALSDADQMMGGEWPAEVWVFARLDADGQAGASEGDVESPRLGPVAKGTADLPVVIGP